MKDLVNYTQALELNKLGFDEKCFTFWTTEGELYESEGYYKKGYNVLGKEVLAPTFSQAFRFFREKYKITSSVRDYFAEEFFYEIHVSFNHEITSNMYTSYEESESACLDKLIEIVKSSSNEN